MELAAAQCSGRAGAADQLRAMNSARAAKESCRTRSETLLATATPIRTPSGERAPMISASRIADVAVAVLAVGADQGDDDDHQQRGRLGLDLAEAEEDVSAGTKRTPPPTPTRPPASPPPAEAAIRMASELVHERISSTAIATSSRPRRGRRRRAGRSAAGSRCRAPRRPRRDRQQQAGVDVDVAVDPALGERAEQPDEDDRGEAGAGREPLAVAEPEDQQRHDHRPAADPEEAAEDAREGADRRQLQIASVPIGRGAVRHRGDTRCRAPRIRDGRQATGPRCSSRCAAIPRRTRDPHRRRRDPGADRRAGRGRGGAGGGARAAGGAERALRPGRLHLRPPGARRRGGWSGSTRSPTPATTGSSCCCRATRRRGRTPRSTGRESEAAEFLAGLDGRGARRAPGCGARTRDRSRRCTGAAPTTRRRRRRAPTRSPTTPARRGWNRAGGARCWSCARRAAAARTPRSPRCSPDEGSTAPLYAGDDRTDLDAFRRLRELREERRAGDRGLRRRRSPPRRRRSWPRSRT